MTSTWITQQRRVFANGPYSFLQNYLNRHKTPFLLSRITFFEISLSQTLMPMQKSVALSRYRRALDGQTGSENAEKCQGLVSLCSAQFVFLLFCGERPVSHNAVSKLQSAAATQL